MVWFVFVVDQCVVVWFEGYYCQGGIQVVELGDVFVIQLIFLFLVIVVKFGFLLCWCYCIVVLFVLFDEYIQCFLFLMYQVVVNVIVEVVVVCYYV